MASTLGALDAPAPMRRRSRGGGGGIFRRGGSSVAEGVELVVVASARPGGRLATPALRAIVCGGGIKLADVAIFRLAIAPLWAVLRRSGWRPSA